MNKAIFNTQWFEIHEIVNTNSNDQIYYGIKAPDYVTCVALDELDQIILVSQYRPVIGKYSLETPGGQVDKGQSPQEAIYNELVEETGYIFNSIKKIATVDPDVGRLMNKLHIYKAYDVKDVLNSVEEGIEVRKYTLNEVNSLINSGSFTSAYSILAISLALKEDI